MGASPRRAGTGLFAGTLRLLAGESLALPSGILITAFLTRRLDPEGFGVFALATAVVVWVEWAVASLFSRQIVREVSAADDWRPVASAALRLSLLAGCAAGALVVAATPLLSRALAAPGLAACLTLYALEVPIFSAARACRSVLVGLSDYGERALVAAARWVARLALVVLFVWMGAGVLGAVAGSVAAAAVELLLCLALLRVTPRGGGLPLRTLLAGAPPLFASAMSLRLFNRLDLFLLKTLGGSVAQAGTYGAAQSVAALPNLVGLSFTPLLMGRLTRMSRRGEGAAARALLGDALRCVLCLAPLAGAVAGGAGGLARLVFGDGYAASAAPLALLAAGAFCLLLLSVATSALTAADRPGLVLAITAPAVALAAAGHLVFIPRAGLAGAAAVTCAVSALGAAAGLSAVYKVWGVPPPARTLCRAALITALSYFAARLWPAEGLALLAEMAAITAFSALTFVATGELSRRESAAAKAALKGWLRRPA